LKVAAFPLKETLGRAGETLAKNFDRLPTLPTQFTRADKRLQADIQAVKDARIQAVTPPIPHCRRLAVWCAA